MDVATRKKSQVRANPATRYCTILVEFVERKYITALVQMQ